MIEMYGRRNWRYKGRRKIKKKKICREENETRPKERETK
jgi:hypothetical protein